MRAPLAGEQVGNYPITQGTLAANSNYTIAFTGSTLTITPAPLTVTANPQTKVYGTADPTLTDTATGLIDATVDGVTIDDTAATVLDRVVWPGRGGHRSRRAGGRLRDHPGDARGQRNYTIAFTGSTLTITPATLTVTAKPETKVFGSADPTLDLHRQRLPVRDTAATVLSGALARAAGETVAGSPYAITQGTLAADGNYTIQFTGNTLTHHPGDARSDLSATRAGPTPAPPFAATATVTGVGGTAPPDLEGVTPTLTYYAGSGTLGTNLGSTAPSAPGPIPSSPAFPAAPITPQTSRSPPRSRSRRPGRRSSWSPTRSSRGRRRLSGSSSQRRSSRSPSAAACRRAR